MSEHIRTDDDDVTDKHTKIYSTTNILQPNKPSNTYSVMIYDIIKVIYFNTNLMCGMRGGNGESMENNR